MSGLYPFIWGGENSIFKLNCMGMNAVIWQTWANVFEANPINLNWPQAGTKWNIFANILSYDDCTMHIQFKLIYKILLFKKILLDIWTEASFILQNWVRSKMPVDNFWYDNS